MKLATLNPTTYGYPALLVEVIDNKLSTVIEISSAQDRIQSWEDIDMSIYTVEQYPEGTEFRYATDSSPYDWDKGCGLYIESYDPIRASL